MRALIIEGEQPRLVTNQADPQAAAGEAVIATGKVAVGALDVLVSRGRFGHQGPLGHQFVGEVESVATDAPAEWVGRRVVGSIHAVCGVCDMCRSGLRTHCRDQTMLGIRGRPGALAERFSLPVMNLMPVDDSLDDEQALMALPLASAIQAYRQLTIEGKPFVTVLGDGPMGLLTAQVMARANVSVRLVGRHAANLARCERWGVKHRQVDDVGRRADQDVVVDCTGRPEGLDLALQLVRPRGTVVIKSIHATPASPIDLMAMVTGEVTMIGSFSGPLDEAMTMLSRRDVDVVGLLGRRMRLDDGPGILTAAAAEGTLPVVVEV